MSPVLRQSAKFVGLLSLAGLCAAVMGLAFAGWQRFSSEIFLTAIENGIAWCL